METKAFFEEYKGSPVIAIWKVDENGNKVGSFPIISMGVKKAKAVIGSINAIREFVTTQDL